MVLETFRQALQNVWSNKLRTFLTMLGIIIGVMAVIVIVGLGNGMTRSMRDMLPQWEPTPSPSKYGAMVPALRRWMICTTSSKEPRTAFLHLAAAGFQRQHPQGGYDELPLRYGVRRG